jgi:RNA polymerase sigma factor (sigma-70 family)
MDSTSPTDEDLMHAYCTGHVAAFQTLYQRHEKPLYRYLCRLLGSALAAQADEVLQDTWMRLIDARDSWQARSDASFKTWLYTLAHHRAVDLLRKSGREASVDAQPSAATGDAHEASDAWQHWPAPETHQPEQQAFWRKAGQQLLQCLDALPAAQRAAFLLHHEDGLSLQDMASALDAEFETIKSRLRYAITKLRSCMGAHLAPLCPPRATAGQGDTP